MTGEFLVRDVALSVFVAFIISQVLLKIITFSRKKGGLFWKAALMGGGMPSTHSAVVSSLLVGIGIVEGVYSPLFVVTFVMGCIVIYQVLVEKKVAKVFVDVFGEKNPEKQLIDQLGHSLREIGFGILVGIIVVAYFYYY